MEAEARPVAWAWPGRSLCRWQPRSGTDGHPLDVTREGIQKRTSFSSRLDFPPSISRQASTFRHLLMLRAVELDLINKLK
jgi:hypothetical protein